MNPSNRNGADRPTRPLSGTLLRAAALLGILSMFGCASTRPAGLGVESGRLSACPDSPNCVSSRATDPVHSIEPLRLRAPAAEVWSALVALLESTPRVEIVNQTSSAHRYLHAEFVSALMRYVDDVEFVESSDRSRIEVRSASRVGYGDMGANRSRIESIRASLAAKGLVED